MTDNNAPTPPAEVGGFPPSHVGEEVIERETPPDSDAPQPPTTQENANAPE